MLAFLLKHDSSQGGFNGHEISNDDKSITVDGKTIPIYAIPDANNCPWGELGVDVVLECTGFYMSREKSQAHLNAGAKKVLIPATSMVDFVTVPPDLMAAFQIIPYQSAEDAVFKALGVE